MLTVQSSEIAKNAAVDLDLRETHSKHAQPQDHPLTHANPLRVGSTLNVRLAPSAMPYVLAYLGMKETRYLHKDVALSVQDNQTVQTN